ncbi:hypothetical protein HQ571_01945 [Candidatus Kuenenbacteria bacterium]|nr:hypothetical protein [Candidatus Kuenenbacteria bacterium]
MKNILLLSLVALVSFGFIFGVYLVPISQAAPMTEADYFTDLNTTGEEFGQDATGPTLPEMIGRIIRIVLGLLGVVMVVLVIYAGFMWMTAGGTPEKVEKAQKIIVQAVIGLAIILAAYAITDFVLGKLIDTVGVN